MKYNECPEKLAETCAAQRGSGLIVNKKLINAISIAYAIKCAANIIYEHADERRAYDMVRESRQVVLDALAMGLHQTGEEDMIIISNRDDLNELWLEMQEVMTDFMPF